MDEFIFKLSDVPNKYEAPIFFGYWIGNFMIMAIGLMAIYVCVSLYRENRGDPNTSPLKIAIFLSLAFLVLAVVTQQQTKQELSSEIPLELYKEMALISRENKDPLMQNMLSNAKKDRSISYMEYYIIKDKQDLAVAQKNSNQMNQTLLAEKERFLN